MKSKDINLLKEIYRNKQQEYKKQIEELLYLEKTMQQKIAFLNDIQNLPLNRFCWNFKRKNIFILVRI